MQFLRGSVGTAIIVTFTMGAAVTVNAADSPWSDGHAQRSLTSVVGVRTLPVLTRRVVRTPEETMSSLIASVTLADRSLSLEGMSRESEKGRLLLTGQGWQLAVFRDGSAAEFTNQAAANRAHKNGVTSSRAMSFTELESAGRDFIARSLRDTVTLALAERLEVEAVSARTEGGVAVDGTSAYSAVVANRVVFAREIDGIPVVGAGSKVTITFLNDGTVESYRYDWPQYASTGRTQEMADVAEILRRVQQVAGVRPGSAAPSKGEPSALPGKGPIDLGGNASLQRIVCGYYDPGVMVREADAPVQAGCYYYVVHTNGEGDFVTRAAYAGAVPAAQVFEIDRSWPEAAELSGTSGAPAPDAPERPQPSGQ